MKKIQLLCLLLVFFFPLSYRTAVKAEQILGTDGQNGQNGQNGNDGDNRDGLTIFLSPKPLNLDLTGQKGFKGEDGSPGQSATCPLSNEPINDNLRGANGGNGGNGGKGGNGGNGGSVSLYTTDISFLKQVFINASGGLGGEGGKGGSGGTGCLCPEPYVTIKTCQGNPGDPQYACSTKQLRCLSGKNGVNGSNGQMGRDGLLGTLTLINSNQPLLDDQLSASVSFRQLKERGYTLSKNVWQTREGAKELLAPGSLVQGQYRFLVNRLDYSFLVLWNTSRSFEPFASQIVTLKLKDVPNGGVEYTLPPEVWLEAKEQKENNRTDLIVYNALLKGEATQLEVVELSGLESELKLQVVDKAKVSDFVNTQWEVTLKTTSLDPRFRRTDDYVTKYQGVIPPQLIERTGNLFTLKLGNLPLNAKELKARVGILIQLKVKRSLGSYSAEQNLTVEDLLKASK